MDHLDEDDKVNVDGKDAIGESVEDEIKVKVDELV